MRDPYYRCARCKAFLGFGPMTTSNLRHVSREHWRTFEVHVSGLMPRSTCMPLTDDEWAGSLYKDADGDTLVPAP